jgi:hypothetical protein
LIDAEMLGEGAPFVVDSDDDLVTARGAILRSPQGRAVVLPSEDSAGF